MSQTKLVGKLVPSPLKKSLRKLVFHINPGDPDVDPHVRQYTPRDLKQLFEKNGFRVERIIGGTLRVPVWTLFEWFGFLLLVWKCLDRFVNALPWGISLKHNCVMEAKKLPKE